MVKNEISLNKLQKNYDKEKLKLEDLTDSWISLLRRKKPIKRKQVLLRQTPVQFVSDAGDPHTYCPRESLDMLDAQFAAGDNQATKEEPFAHQEVGQH